MVIIVEYLNNDDKHTNNDTNNTNNDHTQHRP